MNIYKALRAKAAINKVAKKKNAVEVGIGILTLISLATSTTKKKPKNSKKWGVGGY